MHILIIPSEEYIPHKNSLDGIFQKDQAEVIYKKGNKVGVISISIKYSLIMILKTLFFKVIRKYKYNELSPKSFSFILKTLKNKIFNLKKYITIDNINNIPVIRIESFYGAFLSEKSKYKGWSKGGIIAFNKYVEIYGKPDIIHAHNMVYAGELAVKIKKKYNVPIVITEHSSAYSQGLLSQFLLKRINTSLNQINILYVVSNSLGEILKNKFSNLKTYSYLPNVLDEVFIKTVQIRLKRKKENFSFINVASFIPIKGHVVLIKSFSKAFKNKTHIKLKLIGGGDMKKDLEKLIVQNNVDKQIILVDKLPRNEIIKHLDSSDVFVFSSKSETFGVAIIEALSRGLPVVSTKSGGPESIINQSNGILVNQNIYELSQKLIEIKENINKYNHNEIRKNCIGTYGKEAFYKNIMEIYSSAHKEQSKYSKKSAKNQ